MSDDDCDGFLQFLLDHNYDVIRMQLVREIEEVKDYEDIFQSTDTALCLDNEMLLCTPRVVK